MASKAMIADAQRVVTLAQALRCCISADTKGEATREVAKEIMHACADIIADLKEQVADLYKDK